MSDGHIVALVCEGQTDAVVLKELVSRLWPEIEDVRVLQPELDDTGRTLPGGRSGGWSEVRAWCKQNADDLDDLFDPRVGDPVSLLIVVIDMDVALAAGIADPPRRIGVYESPRLQATVQGWLTKPGRKRLPAQILVSTPVMAIEAWIIAALFRNQRAPERIQNPARFLVEKKKLRRSPNDGASWKELHRYRQFAASVARQVVVVRRTCAEAERTCRGIEEHRAARPVT
jgi:hypothetical protein